MIAPVVVVTEWISVPPLPVEWEHAFLDAVDDLLADQVEVRQAAASGNDDGQEFVLAAFLASRSEDQLVQDRLAAMRNRQASQLALRLGVLACGQSDPSLPVEDVVAALCVDGVDHRRYVERPVSPQELRNTVSQWLLVAARSKSPREHTAGSGLNPDALIARNAVPDDIWLGTL